MLLPPIHPIARTRGLAKHGVTLLVWHDIVPKTKQVWFDTTTAEFDAQLARLARVGAVPISLDTLQTYLFTGKNPPPPGACVLCFDDNTVGIHDLATPRLVKRGWTFVVSAHTQYVGVKTGKAHNTWQMLREMERFKATIVSQTHTHPPDLRLLSDAALTAEMTRSKALMEQQLRHSVRYVTYPSGKWDRRVAEVAARAGYQLGLTEDNGLAELSPHALGIRRFSTHKRFDEAVQAIAASRRGNQAFSVFALQVRSQTLLGGVS